MVSERVTIPCADLKLEGVLETPDGPTPPFPAAVVCHPHPLYGGNMDNNVTMAVARALADRGMAVLRFNFRGTGQSQGKYGEGEDELQDVAAALDFLLARDGVDQDRILTAGYSFGCWVGLKAASQDTRPALLVGVSPPVDMYDFRFLAEESRPICLVAGTEDFVCSQERYGKLLAQLSQPCHTAILKGSDHFHFGREHLVIDEIERFLDRFMPAG